MDPQFASLPVAIYLRGASFGLRAPVRADADVAAAWCEVEPLPSPEAAEVLLVYGERVPWGKNPVTRLMIVEFARDEVVGAVVISRRSTGTCTLAMTVGGRGLARAAVEREVLGLIVPWLLDEIGVRTVSMEVPSDDAERIAALESAGMRLAVRLREQWRRGDGRVDLLIHERVNPHWGKRMEAGDA